MRLGILLNRRDMNQLPNRETDSESGNAEAVKRLRWTRMQGEAD